ncbi:MAG: tetratricopeptide repeat protein [Phycisphaerae bacterium]|nr:tetratricopeptide repeat protein [Phycisphaerae bacterium]MBN8598678.1 tetratricopeptide repeat protein [Planctomycetota bacterium]
MRSIAASVIAASLLFTAGSVARADVGDAAEIETVIVQFRSSKPITPAEVAKIEENVKAAVAARPGDARVRYAKALFDRSKGDRKAAKQAVEALIQEFPDVAEYRSTHGTLCFEIINDAGMFEKMNIASTGRSEYEKAIALDSTLIEPRIGLTRFYLNAPGYAGGSYKRAEEQANALVNLPDGKGEFFGRSLLADIYADKGEWAKVEEQFQLAEASKSPAANPSAAMRGYARLLLNKKKDPNAALVVVERYKKIAAPDDAAPSFLSGEAKKALGDTPGAIEAYTRAVEIDPGAMNSRFALAESLEKNKQYTRAAAEYREFASRFPADSRAGGALKAADRCDKQAK